jgi:hypothetical protein
MSKTYSFLDVNAALVGPGGSINLGSGSGSSEEGITVAADEDISTLVVGADGTPMHSLSANKSGTLTVRLLKTSPVNSILADLYSLQTSVASSHGQNTVTITTTYTQDTITCRHTAFKKAPDLTYAKDGGINEWVFAVGIIDRVLGS